NRLRPGCLIAPSNGLKACGRAAACRLVQARVPVRACFLFFCFPAHAHSLPCIGFRIAILQTLLESGRAWLRTYTTVTAMSTVKISCQNVWQLFGKNASGFLEKHQYQPTDEQLAEAGLVAAVRDVSFDVHA